LGQSTTTTWSAMTCPAPISTALIEFSQAVGDDVATTPPPAYVATTPIGQALRTCPGLIGYCQRSITTGANGQWTGCHMHYNRLTCHRHYMSDAAGTGAALCIWRTLPSGNEECQADADPSPSGGYEWTCNIGAWTLLKVCPLVTALSNRLSMFNMDGNADISDNELGEMMKAEGMQPTQTELTLILGGASSISIQNLLSKAVKYLDTDTDDSEDQYWKSNTCTVGQQVPCPVTGSAGNLCSGNQCCPGVQETGGLPFPCPSAAETWCDCAHKAKLRDCTTTTGTQPTCPGSCPQICTDEADTQQSWKLACAALPTDCAECAACCQ
jgi:hypothetical protein